MSKENSVTRPSSRQNLPCRKPSAWSKSETLVTQDKPSCFLPPQTSGAQQWCDCQRKRGIPGPGCQPRSHFQGPWANGEEVGGKGQPSSAWMQRGAGTATLSLLTPSAQLKCPLPRTLP